MGATAPVVVHILSNVRELRKLAECAYDRHRGLVAELIQNRVQLLTSFGVLLPAKPDRGLADIFHQIESWLAFLFSKGIAQHSPEQTDVFPQGVILDVHLIYIHVSFPE